MAYDPMQGFQIGQAIGKSKKSPYATALGGVMDEFENQAKNKQAINLEKAKQSIVSPLDQARINYLNTQSSAKAFPTQKKVFGFRTKSGQIIDPDTGHPVEGNELPPGSVLRNMKELTNEESDFISSADEITNFTIPRMIEKIKSNPDVIWQKNIPFMERDFAKDWDFLFGERGFGRGGKAYTESEKQVIKTNLPTLQDRSDPQVMIDKLNTLNRVAYEKANMLRGSVSSSRLFGGSNQYSDPDTGEQLDIEKERQDALDEIRNRPGSRKFVEAEFKRLFPGEEL